MDKNIKEELERIITKYKLHKKDFCIVGSYSLNSYINRKAEDIDLCLNPNVRKRIIASQEKEFTILKGSGTINWKDGLIQSASNRYWRIGISDQELLTNTDYLIEDEDYLIVRPEIEYSNKLFRKKEKDLFDTADLLNIVLNSKLDWNWGLVKDFDPIKKDNSNNFRRFVSRLKNKLKFIFSTFNRQKLDNKTINISRKVDIAKIITDQLFENEILSYLSLLTSEIKKFRNDMDINQAIIISKIIQKHEGYFVHPQELFSIVFNNDHFSDEGYYAILNSNGYLCMGGFNMVVLLINNQFQIKIFTDNTIKTNGSIYYNETSQIQLIQNNYPSLIIDNSGFLFYSIIWSPGVHLESAINNDIIKQYNIIDSFSLKFNDDGYNNFVHDIYNLDRIEEWKIQKKLFYMRLNSKQNKVSIARIFIPNPQFREKNRTKSYLSSTTAMLKNEIRSNYKSKIENYTHDILIHISDNFGQNVIIKNIINKYKD